MKRLSGGKRARGVCQSCYGFQATAEVDGRKLCWVCAHMIEMHPDADPLDCCRCAPAAIYPADVRVGLSTP